MNKKLFIIGILAILLIVGCKADYQRQPNPNPPYQGVVGQGCGVSEPEGSENFTIVYIPLRVAL